MIEGFYQPNSPPRPGGSAVLTLGLLALAVLAPAGAAQNLPRIPKDGVEVTRTRSGLSYSVLHAGSDKGAAPRPGDAVTFHYAGWLPDGRLFETSLSGRPREMILGVRMPKGWIEGMQLMRPGSRFKFTLPADLAYGATGLRGNPPLVPAVPPGAMVIFEIELFAVDRGIELPEFRFANARVQKRSASGLAFEVLKSGRGEAPRPGERFTVGYDLFNQRGQLVATSRAPGQVPIVGQIGKKIGGPQFLREAVTLLRRGARMRFEVPAKRCYGEKGNGFLVPPNSTTVWVLELLRLDPPPQPREVPAFARPSRYHVQRAASGLQFEVVKAGKGRRVKATDTLLFHFAGWTAAGRCFDETFSSGLPLEIDLSQKGKVELVPGLREGLLQMTVGAVHRFLLPAKLGYGLRGRKDLGIGPNRRLYFQVELVGIRQDQR